MFSKRSLEGELLIDHRASPGIRSEDVNDPTEIVVGPGEVFESAVNTCGHCWAVIVLNPNRSRERGWCSKCDTYVCDGCQFEMTKTLQCNTVRRRVDQLLEEIERGTPVQFLTRL